VFSVLNIEAVRDNVQLSPFQ